MAKDSDPLASAFETKESGLFAKLLAEENDFDRRTMWRLGSWGVGAVAAVVVAVMANQAQITWRHDQVAAAEREAERLEVLTRESRNETRRLASAIETLNTDRDRLYSRVTVLEQGLDSVTGAIARQAAAPAAPAQPAPAKPAAVEPTTSTAPQASSSQAPGVAPVASTPSPPNDKPRTETAKDPPGSPPQPAAAASLVATPAPPARTAAAAQPSTPPVVSTPVAAMPDPAASKPAQPEQPAKPQAEPAPPAQASAAPATKEDEAAAEGEAPTPAITVQQTRFAVDLGSASSIDGLRAMWRGLIKSNPEIASLRPIIMIKEGRTGLGMQLRLGAGPLINAAAAAKFCAALIENGRACETTVFDGQRLSMRGEMASTQSEAPAGTAKLDARSDARADAKSDTRPDEKSDTKPATRPERSQHRRGYSSKRSRHEEPAPQPPAPAAKPESTSALSSFFRRN